MPRTRLAPVRVRKPIPAAPTAPPDPPRLPLFEQLLLPAGRGELERLIRKHGGRRPRLVAAIAATHRRADGELLGDAELDAALEHHGLDRGFVRRERDELVHAVRAAGAILATAATALGHDAAGLASAISRLELDVEIKGLREARRRDLRARSTLAQRALLLVGRSDQLADLELLGEFEQDLRSRLPEHLRALAVSAEPLEQGLARTLALPGAAVRELLVRLGVELRAPVAGPKAVAGPRPMPKGGPPRRVGPPVRPASPRGGPGSPSRSSPGGRPPGARPGRPPGAGGPPGSGRRQSTGRPGRKGPTGPRPPGAGPRGGRPAAPRRAGPGGGRRGPVR